MWSQLSALSAERQRFILVTVIERGGSTPRGVGAQMIVTGDKNYGTIGGGALEYQAIKQSLKVLNQDPQTNPISYLEFHLSHDLGMCCGGQVNIMLHDYPPSPRLIIFGAGHVGQALAQIASFSDFNILVIDDREEWIDPQRFPDSTELICNDAEHALRELSLGMGDYVVVTTYDHALDERIISSLTKFSLTYLGLIGSQAKWLRFQKRLRIELKDTIRVERLENTHCPMGLPIKAETPHEIAISIMAEVISVYRRKKNK